MNEFRQRLKQRKLVRWTVAYIAAAFALLQGIDIVAQRFDWPPRTYFCEGVPDEILTRLAKVADLKVISRTSTQKFKSAPANLREIAKQLGVMHVVEGSVQKSADQVRVNVQLINAMTRDFGATSK